MKKVLITGAGTGFGYEVAMRLALKGFDVISAVEIYAQVQTLKREAAARGVTLQVEKLDVTNEGDRKKAIYSASKHAVEAIAQTMSLELQEFGVEVATINPGPFLTGFNDRGFETWRSWVDEASERLYDYSKLAFPRAQFDPEPVYATMTAVAAGEIDAYRNLEPKSMIAETKSNMEAPWNRKVTDGLGSRPASVQKAFEMKPETLAA